MGCEVAAALLLLGVAALNVANAQDYCQTPDKNNGKCVNLKQCASLFGRLTSPSRQPSDIQYLKDSQCGWEGSTPKVCCPDRQPFPTVPIECGRYFPQGQFLGTRFKEYPWMTLLEYRTPAGTIRAACGGALINERYVVTAAHCLKSKDIPQSWTLESVRLGEYNTVTERDCIPNFDGSFLCMKRPPLNVRIEERIIHEDYDPLSSDLRHDIALLRLSQDVQFTDYIRPICLPSTSDLSRHFAITGWGITLTGQESDVKLTVNLPLADKRNCSVTYQQEGVTLGAGQFCAGGEKDIESCGGASGGPLMQLGSGADRRPRWMLVGVVSFGPTYCGSKGVPGVYTKVYDYAPWIMGKLKP